MPLTEDIINNSQIFIVRLNKQQHLLKLYQTLDYHYYYCISSITIIVVVDNCDSSNSSNSSSR